MATLAKLEISDGTTTVNLLTGTRQTGFSLRNWDPAVIQPKGGGVFQDSPIAPGRRLVYAVDATAIEELTVDLNDYDQDGLIAQAQDLMRLLLKARAYQSTEFQDEPVYIRARSSCETNDRYALIINWSIPQLSNPYAQPFVSATEISTMDELSLQLERGHWRVNAPGTGECVPLSALQNWEYLAEWLTNSTDPVEGPYSLLQAGNGDIYAGDNGDIWSSTDLGGSWAVNTALPAGIVSALFQAANGYIYAGDNGQILRTIDNGANWTVVTAGPVDLVQALTESGAYILAGDDSQIWRSPDNGTTWAAVALPSPSGDVRGFARTPEGVVYLIAGYSFMRSTDNGATWSIVSYLTFGTGSLFNALVRASDGTLYAGVLVTAADELLLKSTDEGETWTILKDDFTANGIYSLLVDSNDNLYIGDGDGIWFTPDGRTFLPVVSGTGAAVQSLLETSEPAIYAGAGGVIYKNDLTSIELGAEDDTCSDLVYVGNRQNVANLTHIFISDGGVFSSIFPMGAFPVDLYPAAIAVNDALYFGSEIAITNSGPFAGLVFDILTIIPPTISRTITWEFWSGAAWSALTVQDGTNDGAGGFGHPGVCSVHWIQPSNWATTAVNGITAYWVRARVSAVGVGVITPPSQQNRQIYAVNSAFLDITGITGDIPAIAQLKVRNRSDHEGRGANPELWMNRLVAGLRSRDDDFLAYINISDEQNPPGITISLAVATTSFETNIGAPTGRRATVAPTGAEAMQTRVTITFGPQITPSYYGLFHAFLRVSRGGLAATDFSVRLQVETGRGGIIFTTVAKSAQTTTIFEVLDFGEIQIPVSGSFKNDELPDEMTIRIQASAVSAVPVLRFYDLVLIPVDEWAVDAVDFANETESVVGEHFTINNLTAPGMLDIDSITDPRFDIKTLARTFDSNNYIYSEYNPICNGPAILQANTSQRLWFFAMQTSATGTSYSWLAPPEIAHSIQIFKNEGYLGLVGAGG